MLNYFFKVPFADLGDKAAIPQAVQGDGTVSFTQGFGPDYELPYSNANSKDVPRDKSNQLNYAVTKALQEYQTNGVPDWIDPAQNGGVNFPYPAGATVRYSDGLIYVSQKAANNSLPTVAADWFQETGRLIRTTRYVRVAGVQNVSVDGAANTTSGAGTHTRLAGAKFLRVKVQGAGSGGAGGAAPAAGLVSLGAPGCAGSYAESLFTAAAFGASQTITVGLGSAGNSGAVGGTSSVGALTTAPGGAAAGGLAGQTPPTVNGTGTTSGAPTGANLLSIVGAAPQLTIAQSATVGNGGAGGASMFGPGGNGPVINTNGTNAINPGSGGSGCLVNSGGGTATGGAGAAGIIIIEEYA